MTRPIVHPKSLTARCVAAILSGRKSQLRQAIEPQPPEEAAVTGIDEEGRLRWTSGGSGTGTAACPMGVPGHLLWVREPWALPTDFDGAQDPASARGLVWYRADRTFDPRTPRNLREYGGVWRPAQDMPRWASRLTLEVLAVRAERIHEISREDLDAEGGMWRAEGGAATTEIDRADFAHWWTDVNPERSAAWDRNPWVWVVHFRRRTIPEAASPFDRDPGGAP